MTKFKFLGAVAVLSTLTAAPPQAYAIEGREVAAPPWSFACMSDQGPRDCGEPMWVYGARDDIDGYSPSGIYPPASTGKASASAQRRLAIIR
jgi:hypothetical protein